MVTQEVVSGREARDSGKRREPWFQLFGPDAYEFNQVRLPIRALLPGMEGVRLLHLTDFHFGAAWPSAYDDLIERVEANPPDLILITGDFVDNRRNHSIGLPAVRKLLAALRSRDGVFGILGNHDGTIGPDIDGNGVVLLDRQVRRVAVRGGEIELVGLPRLSFGKMDRTFLGTLAPRTAGVPRVILSHYSDYMTVLDGTDPDLFLSGHTHGGQVCLPDGTALLKHTALPRRYCHGIHRLGDTWLIANRGLGYTTLPIRLFCPAEVIEIELASEAD